MAESNPVILGNDGEVDVAGMLDQIWDSKPAPDTDDAPEAPAPVETTPEIQPQDAADESPPAEQANASEDAQAPADEVPAPVEAVTQKAPQPASPEVDARVREADAAKTEALTARDQYVSQLNVLIQQTEAQFLGEFADIKTQDDLLDLGQSDPMRYNRAVIALQKLNNVKQAHSSEKAKADTEQQEKFQAWQAEQVKLLPDLIPELRDKDKGPALIKRIKDFAASMDYPPEQLAKASANDFLILKEAMEFRGLKEAQAIAAKKAAKAPPVQQPGAQKVSNENDKAKTDYERLRKTGHRDDLAALLQHII